MGRKQKIRREREANSGRGRSSSSSCSCCKRQETVDAVLEQWCSPPGAQSEIETHYRCQCYHGSTKEAFNNAEYQRAIDAWDELCYNRSRTETTVGPKAFEPLLRDFYDCLSRLLYDDGQHEEFCKFVFAWCTDHFLRGGDENDLRKITEVLRLGIKLRYAWTAETTDHHKLQKYTRATLTQRGIVNCLARETKSHCDCMKESKHYAKSLEKMVPCIGCNKAFPKQQMLRCSGCGVIDYCSRKCQVKDWHVHKEHCKLLSTFMNNNNNKEAADKNSAVGSNNSKPSKEGTSTEETMDGWQEAKSNQWPDNDDSIATDDSTIDAAMIEFSSSNESPSSATATSNITIATEGGTTKTTVKARNTAATTKKKLPSPSNSNTSFGGLKKGFLN